MADGVQILACPCNQKADGIRANSVTITCSKCNIKWHTKCVGLYGMSSKDAAKYSEWCCSCCFTMPNMGDSGLDKPSLQDQIKAEVLRILPFLVTAVVKQTETATARTYTAVTKESRNICKEVHRRVFFNCGGEGFAKNRR